MIEMTYGKKITSDIGLSLSGSVFYSNVMSLPIMLILAVSSGELQKVALMQGSWMNLPALSWLVRCRTPPPAPRDADRRCAATGFFGHRRDWDFVQWLVRAPGPTASVTNIGV